jgi:hypothetical protein
METLTNQNNVNLDDPLDAAMAAEARPQGPRTYFGQIAVDVYHCILQKGAGKVIFDPGQHSPDQRCTAITLTFVALPRDNGASLRPMEFQMIAESKEWASIVKPSLIAINADLRTIRDRYVQVQMVPTGRTYKNKAGEVKDANTLKFVALYGSEEECRAASDAHFSHGHNATPAAAVPTQQPVTADAERATAAKFLPALWKASANNVQRFEQLIKQTAPVNKYFDLTSAEVLSLITATPS